MRDPSREFSVDEAQACVSFTSRHDLLSVFQWAFRQLRYMCSTFNSRVLVTAEGVGAGLHCAACFSERDLSRMGLRQAGLLPAGVAKVFQCLLSVFQWAFRQLRYMCSTFNSRVLVTAEGVGAGLHCAACFSERDLSRMGLRQAGLLPAGVAKVFQWIFDDCRVFRRA
jgi:uncharacterized Fe-S cluster-containing radical SAM superfamily protein